MDKNFIIGKLKKLIFFLKLDDENIFKIRAYENAIDKLKSISEPLDILVKNNELKSYEGIGNAIFNKIKEIIETEKLSALEEYYQKFPESLYQFRKISGLGPKKISKLYTDYNIDNIEKLDKFIKSENIYKVKGFGKKTVEKLKNEIEFLFKNENEFLAYDYLNSYKDIQQYINNNISTKDFLIMPAGKLRRYANTISEGDIIISSEKKKEVINCIEKWDLIDDINIYKNHINFYYQNKYFNIIFSRPRNFAYKLLKTTGSREFFDHLKTVCSNLDSINEKNISDERKLYNILNLNFIPPECREKKDAVELFKDSDYNSQLIRLSDIKGIIHIHSEYSDGHNTIEEIAEYLYNLNYQYVVITDHSKSSYYAGGLNSNDLRKQWDEIKKVNSKYNDFKIYKGIEVDILNDGKLDYKKSILDNFDFIIGSIHSNLDMDAEKATERILRAMDYKLDMIGHISGRLLTQRKGYGLDYNSIFKKAADKNIFIEFNCNPYRMDIDWKYLTQMKELGIKTSLNPDAHSKDHINYMQYGIKFLRKALLNKEDVLNTLSLKEFNKMI